MLNKKGFTIAEVMVSFSLISVLLITIVSSTMYYRDEVKSQEVVTQLWDFKNDITKTVYDDIINKRIVSAENCFSGDDCVNLIDKNGVTHVLKIVDDNNDTSKGVYLYYDNYKYMLPDSDLGTGTDRVCDFSGGIDVENYEEKLYKIKATFVHKDMDLKYDLLFVIS